jgi:toxin ParE1/3/4
VAEELGHSTGNSPPAMHVTWHRRARQDLRHLRAQIAADNPQAAQRVAQRILQAVELLAEQPGMGRVGRVPDTREFVITGTPYIAAYQVLENTLVILRVLHGARQWPEQF